MLNTFFDIGTDMSTAVLNINQGINVAQLMINIINEIYVYKYMFINMYIIFCDFFL